VLGLAACGGRAPAPSALSTAPAAALVAARAPESGPTPAGHAAVSPAAPPTGAPRAPATCNFLLTTSTGQTAIVVFTTSAGCVTLRGTLGLLGAGRHSMATPDPGFTPSVPPTCSSNSGDQTPMDVFPDGGHYQAAADLCALLHP